MEPRNEKSVDRELLELDEAIQAFVHRMHLSNLSPLPPIWQLVTTLQRDINALLKIRSRRKEDLEACFSDFQTHHTELISRMVGQTLKRLEETNLRKAETFKFILFEGGKTRSRFQELLLNGDIIATYSSRFRYIYEKVQALPHGGFPPTRKT